MPIMYILPIGIHKRGKIVLVGIALLGATLFTFTIQVIPIWQAAAAIIVILLSLGFLFSKNPFLFEQVEVIETVENRNEITVMNEEQINSSKKTTIEAEESVPETDNTASVEARNMVDNDVSPIEEEKDDLVDFFKEFDTNTHMIDEVSDGQKTELNTLSEVASAIEKETFITRDEKGISDDFLLELFEGRDSEEIIDHNTKEEMSETKTNLSLGINDFFENMMNDTPYKNVGEASDKAKDMMVDSELENIEILTGEKVVIEENYEFMETIIEEPLQKEAGDVEESILEEMDMKPESTNKTDVSNHILDMLLDQLHIYKQFLPATEYEHVLQKAVQEAKSEKDCFLFAKELLIYYLQTDNKEKYDLLVSDMNEKLKNYPILIEQLRWIQ